MKRMLYLVVGVFLVIGACYSWQPKAQAQTAQVQPVDGPRPQCLPGIPCAVK